MNGRAVHWRLTNPDESIVADGFSFFNLLRAQDADQASCNQTARKRGWQTEHENIQRIPVGRASAGYGPEVIREYQAGGKYTTEAEDAQLLVELIFVRGSLPAYR